jgi:hypothetical protein
MGYYLKKARHLRMGKCSGKGNLKEESSFKIFSNFCCIMYNAILVSVLLGWFCGIYGHNNVHDTPQGESKASLGSPVTLLRKMGYKRYPNQ